MASPRPVPSGCASRPRANGSSSRSRSSAGMPVPSSSTRMTSSPVGALEADLHAAALAAPVQGGVVEQVVDDQAQAALPAVDPPLLDVAGQLEADAGVALARAVDGGVEHVAELDRLPPQALGRLAARERLEPLEQVDHPVLLGGHVGHQRVALLRRDPGVAGQRVEVRAHRGQRGAQLVAGVGGEAAGRLERALGGLGRRAEAGEHRVERARELMDLLRALVGQRRREVLRSRDPRGARAQPRERPQRDRGGAPGRQRRQRERGEAEQQHEPADRARRAPRRA